MMSVITIRTLRRTRFAELYGKLIKGESLTDKEKQVLLTLAVILLNAAEDSTQALGYRIVLNYCNTYKTYIPLYDVAINKGYIPIAKAIESFPENTERFDSRFFNVFQSCFKSNFYKNGIYLTLQQLELNDFFNSNISKTVAVVAPTSYGKSELMVSTISKNPTANICIIVPTKALLSQTKSRLLNAKIGITNRIITHPEMYHGETDSIVAVLTQERLLRLLQKYPEIYFHLAFIDEAHNLLEDETRSRLLASVIALLEQRNPRIAFKFLTPFIVNVENLKVAFTSYEIANFSIDEHLKIEKYFCIDFNHESRLKLYDQFLNDFLEIDSENFQDDIDLLIKKAGTKNIVYLNSPPSLENFAAKLAQKTSLVSSPKISKAIKEIADYLDTNYALISCLEKGVVYHHGSVPDNIRLYMEHLFSTEKDISYIVTSSTLLEGVNIPADRLFILDYRKGRRKLSPSQFKNLVGRACRFKEVFGQKPSYLELLEPNIYVISSDYTRSGADVEGFLQDSARIDKKVKDDPQNVLLKTTAIIEDFNDSNRKDAESFLENIEPGITGNKDNRLAETSIGKACFTNNITEIDILKVEEELQSSFIAWQKVIPIANKTNDVCNFIANVFVPFIVQEDDHENLNISRFAEQHTQDFYSMLLSWRTRDASYKEMIRRFIKYWDRLLKEGREPLVYVGKWGDQVRDGGFRKLWVNISEKSIAERINLAIVRIKEEQDFIDNSIMKFVEVMNDLEAIDSNLYLRIKYGTDDVVKIVLIKNGLSNALSTLLLNKYNNYLDVDIDNSNLHINPKLLATMRNNNENEILIFEASLNIGTKEL